MRWINYQIQNVNNHGPAIFTLDQFSTYVAMRPMTGDDTRDRQRDSLYILCQTFYFMIILYEVGGMRKNLRKEKV